MEFFKCSIAGVTYGTGVTEIERAAARRNGQELPPPLDAAAAKACSMAFIEFGNILTCKYVNYRGNSLTM